MAEVKETIPSAFWKGAAGATGAALMVWLMGWVSPVWSFAHHAFESLSTHLMAQSHWPNWSAYLVSLWAAMSFFIWAARNWRNRKDNSNRFTQLNFRGVVWRWSSISSLPYSLSPYCPQCDLLLVYEETGGRFSGEPSRVNLHCERCSTVPARDSGTMEILQNRVHREIDRLIRTGQWRQHVPESLPK